jgi:hypothetical protein
LIGSACTALALNAANNIIAIGGVQETGSALYGIAVQIVSTSGSILSSHKLTLPSGISLTNLEGVRDLKLASDGGFVFCFPARLANGETDIMVVKLTNNGLLDTAFGNGGFHQITRQGEQGLPELTLSPQGDIWISYKEISTSQIGLHHLKQNSAPSDLSLSTSSFNENIAAGTTIATLSSSDPEVSDTFTYTLVSGSGDTDNAAFSIIGNQLKINASPNYESKSSYSLRVRTTDAGGLFTEKAITLGVNNVKEVIRGNSLYTIVDGPSWTQAEANSVRLGGHLTNIGSLEENSWLSDKFGNIGRSPLSIL